MSNGSAPGVVLVVLDGWGYRQEREGNAIELASTPTWHRLWKAYPRTLLEASGLAVGLPEGQMGNSEVGHLNLGAGRVVPQDLVRISQSIQSGEFYTFEPAGPALRRAAADRRHPSPRRPARAGRGPCPRPAPAGLRRAGHPPQGPIHRHSRLSRWPRLGADPRRGGGPHPAPWTCAGLRAARWTSRRSPAGTTEWTGTAAGNGPSWPTTPWSTA